MNGAWFDEPDRRFARQRHRAFHDFFARVGARLDTASASYGDRSFGRSPGALAAEIEEEALDVAAWNFILWCRVRELAPATKCFALTVTESTRVGNRGAGDAIRPNERGPRSPRRGSPR